MTLEELLAALSALSALLVAIQAYLVYRLEKARLRLESYIGISEKSELEIKPETQPGENENIKITNKGLIPTDEIKTKIDITVERRNKPSLPLHLEWERRTVLSSKEVAVIPLYEKLTDFFERNKLVSLVKSGEFSSEDPETGEEVTDTLDVPRLRKPFSLILHIEVESKIEGQVRNTRKKFRFNYRWKHPESYSGWEADYEVLINEHMGEWKTT